MTTTKLTGRSGMQTAAALKYLDPTEATASTITFEGVSAGDVLLRIQNAIDVADRKGDRQTLHSLRRCAERMVADQNADATVDQAIITPVGRKAAGLKPADVVEVPTFDPDPTAMLALAKSEAKSLKAWKSAGAVGDPPVTPNLDEMNRVYAATGSTKSLMGKASKTREPKAPRETRSFKTADHPDGHTCVTCGTSKPVASFPTISGPDVRGVECRTCRDTARKAKAAPEAVAV